MNLNPENPLTKPLQLAIKCAVAAGQYLKSQLDQSQQINLQDDRELKLQVDQDAEAIITNLLSSQSSYPILAEESGASGPLGQSLYWVVDPLDGTYNYLRRIPMSCVSIALVNSQRQPMLGVIEDFNTGKRYVGINSPDYKQAWCNQKPLVLNQHFAKNRAVLATGFPALFHKQSSDLEGFLTEMKAFKKTRMTGSAAISLAWLAEGLVDAYYEFNTMLWDVAAGIAIIEAAGGVVQMTPSVSAGHPWAFDVRAASHQALL